MGTPNLIGTYRINMGVLIRASSPPDLFGRTLAASDCGLTADLQLRGICEDCGELRGFTGSTFLLNNLYPSVDAPPPTCVEYAIAGPGGTGAIPVIDNADGTYTVRYNWSVTLPGEDTRSDDTTIRLEITSLRDCTLPPPSPFNKLIIATVPDYFRTIPGTPLKSGGTGTDQFFNHATPDWRGCGNPV